MLGKALKVAAIGL
ncbi:hypothetical protein D030_3782A, partial [Vibrio parahaemolyticus AQ3810]